MVELTRDVPVGEPLPDLAATQSAALDAAMLAPAADIADEGRSWADRSLWTMVGVGLLWWSWQLIGDSYQPWTVPFLVGANLWGLGTIIASWLPENRWTRNSKVTNRWAWATAVLTVSVFVTWAIVSLTGGLDYGTDAIAFNQYAAMLVQHGLNPYTHSMAPAFQLFRTPTSYYTYSFTGSPVTTISYPSLSFLIYVPFLLLGWSNNVAPTLDMIAWGSTVLLMFALLPKRARPAAILFGGYGLYVVFAMGGVTDALFMPLLVIAAYRWDRFGENRRTYIAPIMFGLAMGIKQTPWPALPFILLALACDEYARTGLRQGIIRAGKYLAVVMVVFIVPNIPWFVANPSAWVKGTLTPLFANMVPTGQGTMSLSLYLHLGGGSMMAFTAATVLMMALMLVLYVGTYPLLRVGMFVLPAFVFFFAARSNVNYFISLIPAGFVAAVTAGPAVRKAQGESTLLMAGRRFSPSGTLRSWIEGLYGHRRLFRTRPWLLATAVIGFLTFVAAADSLTAKAPLSIKVTGLTTTGTTNRIEQLSLRVDNTSGKAITPSFDIMEGGFNSTFWLIAAGPKQLAPHSHASYSIEATNADAQPSVYGGFNVVGYVPHPESFSVAPTYKPYLLHIGFDPQTIDKLQAVGKPVHIGVQVYSVNGGLLRRAGVRVRLGGIVWTNVGPKKAWVQINGDETGHAAVAFTNSQGIANFTVVAVKATKYPVSFSAFLLDHQFNYLYGDTGNLNIRFVAR